jgi:hypothetical protein
VRASRQQGQVRGLRERVGEPVGKIRSPASLGDEAREPRVAEEGRRRHAQRHEFGDEYPAREQAVVAQLGSRQVERDRRQPHRRAAIERHAEHLGRASRRVDGGKVPLRSGRVLRKPLHIARIRRLGEESDIRIEVIKHITLVQRLAQMASSLTNGRPWPASISAFFAAAPVSRAAAVANIKEQGRPVLSVTPTQTTGTTPSMVMS